MSDEETTQDQHIWVLLKEERYATPAMAWATHDYETARSYIEEHVDDMGEWVGWDDGGGIIWQSDESHVDGYSIRKVEVRS